MVCQPMFLRDAESQSFASLTGVSGERESAQKPPYAGMSEAVHRCCLVQLTPWVDDCLTS